MSTRSDERREQIEADWQRFQLLLKNPVVELIVGAVVLNWLTMRNQELARLYPPDEFKAWLKAPPTKYVQLPASLATIVGGTLGAAVMAQQLGPEGVRAVGSGTADLLKLVSAAK